MPHFLIKKEELKDGFIELNNNENFFHLTKVLRVRRNEKINFIDENKTVFECVIEDIEKNCLRAKIIKSEKSKRFLKTKISLIQSVLSSDSQNLAVANAVQCGVFEIYPVKTDNIYTNKNNSGEKIEKWQRIAYENFKQCERADIPKIHEICTLEDVICKFKKENVLIFAEKYENTNLNLCLSDIDKHSEIAVIIGPEGGFSKREFEFFINQNYKLITLGKMILKAPNAIVAAVSNIVSRIEDV